MFSQESDPVFSNAVQIAKHVEANISFTSYYFADQTAEDVKARIEQARFFRSELREPFRMLNPNTYISGKRTSEVVPDNSGAQLRLILIHRGRYVEGASDPSSLGGSTVTLSGVTPQ